MSTAAAVVKAMTSTDHSSTSHLTQSPKIHQTRIHHLEFPLGKQQTSGGKASAN